MRCRLAADGRRQGLAKPRQGTISNWAKTTNTDGKRGLAMSTTIEIITRFEAAFRANDQATIDEICDPCLVDHNIGHDLDGTLAAFKEKAAYFVSLFPDIKEEMQD